jgi:3-methyladenine DNA glycosylase AlkD
MKPIKEVQEIIDVYRAYINEERAKRMSAYMKNLFPFAGIPSPLRKSLSKEFLKHKFTDEAEIRSAVKQLWDLPEREFQYLAIELMSRKKKYWTEEWLGLIENLILSKSWWDTVDGLAASIAGIYFLKFPGKKKQSINQWIASENMWLNRTAIIFQLKYKKDVDQHLLTESILRHNNSGEFFHQKAIGWALRQYSKFNPEWVARFLKEHQLKPLSIREASKYLGTSKK